MGRRDDIFKTLQILPCDGDWKNHTNLMVKCFFKYLFVKKESCLFIGKTCDENVIEL